MPKPYDVLDVCHYIVKYCHEKKYTLTNLKLQKLLYFIQVFFLVKTEEKEKCFYQAIQAWDFGPVVSEAYREYKQFGAGEIEYSETKTILNANFEFIQEKYSDPISKKDKRYIEFVIDSLKDYSAYSLVQLTHQQAPWKNAYSKGYGIEISCTSIVEYFSK